MSLVEYHDPDNVFDLVLKQLQPHLPLTNLHWKSSTRPLRSISNLHVDFVSVEERRDAYKSGALSPSSVPADQETASTIKESSGSGVNSRQRHQIPGLRRSPYLKVYMLRCDDKDTYKSTSRDLVRAWMKSDIAPTKSSSTSIANDHDAYEWLILHVVFPGTPAASEPRWSKKSSDLDAPKERSSSTAKWPGKGSRTILERLRADFNQSGKSALDRIAQIRLPKDAIPETLRLAQTASEESTEHNGPQDQINAFNDLITKLKTLILKSFDLRVGQYEDDIREKEEQKSLPGWNFCTFFVLKEGLARAFENVGLLEDALSAYDELDASLDSSLRDMASAGSKTQVTSFLEFTPNWKALLEDFLKARSKKVVNLEDAKRPSQLPLAATKKDYRTLIVSNNISVYDLRSYLFARQMHILLALTGSYQALDVEDVDTAAPQTDRQSLSTSRNSSPYTGVVRNIMALADLCRRAVKFIPNMTRALRLDLRNACSELGSNKDLDEFMGQTIFVHTFCIAQQFLNETAIFESLVEPALLEQKRMSVSRLSQSNSSSVLSSSRVSLAAAKSSTRSIESFDLRNLKDVDALQNPELRDIASCRAQLYMFQKQAIKDILNSRSLSDKSVGAERKGSIDQADEAEIAMALQVLVHHFSCDELKMVLLAEDELIKMNEKLVNLAARSFALSNHRRSAEKLIIDLARLKYENGNFSSAATYFSQVLPQFSLHGWSAIEDSSLKVYAQCLKSLKRNDEYVQVLLALLTKETQSKTPKTHHGKGMNYKSTPTLSNGANQDTMRLIEELVVSSNQLPNEFSTSVDPHFANVQVDPGTKVFEDQDGFQIALRFKQLIAERLIIDYAVVRLISSTDIQARGITLETTEPVEVETGDVLIWLKTRANAVGYFTVDKITIKLGKIAFTYEPSRQAASPSIGGLISDNKLMDSPAQKSSHLMIYQRSEALYAEVVCSKTQYFGKIQTLDVFLHTGSNEISSATVVLRSATAGLRIYTSEAKVVQGEASILTENRAGQIPLDSLVPRRDIRVRVPYNVERNLREISVRLEIHYTTPKGTFSFMSDPVVPVDFKVGLGLQVIFKRDYLYSKFLIQPERKNPIQILNTYMTDSENYETEPLLPLLRPFTVQNQNSIGITYRIRRKNWQEAQHHPTPIGMPNLTLKLTYSNLQHQISDSITNKLLLDIEKSAWRNFGRILKQSAEKKLAGLVTKEFCESASLTKQYVIPPIQDLGWIDVAEHAPRNVREGLQYWLAQWHQANSTLELTEPGADSSWTTHTPTELIIDFAFPKLHYLHTAALKIIQLDDTTSETSGLSARPMRRLGESISTRLEISYTRRWDHELKQSAQDFIYEIHADPATWLIVGNQSAQFCLASEDESYTAELFLIPLKTGTLFLPTVDVKIARKTKQSEILASLDGRESLVEQNGADFHDNAAQMENAIGSLTLGQGREDLNPEDIQCQTDCTSLHSCIVVLAAARSTTIDINSYADEAGQISDRRDWKAELISSQPWE